VATGGKLNGVKISVNVSISAYVETRKFSEISPRNGVEIIEEGRRRNHVIDERVSGARCLEKPYANAPVVPSLWAGETDEASTRSARRFAQTFPALAFH
jgi:hypothetical protein